MKNKTFCFWVFGSDLQGDLILPISLLCTLLELDICGASAATQHLSDVQFWGLNMIYMNTDKYS